VQLTGRGRPLKRGAHDPGKKNGAGLGPWGVQKKESTCVGNQPAGETIAHLEEGKKEKKTPKSTSHRGQETVRGVQRFNHLVFWDQMPGKTAETKGIIQERETGVKKKKKEAPAS